MTSLKGETSAFITRSPFLTWLKQVLFYLLEVPQYSYITTTQKSKPSKLKPKPETRGSRATQYGALDYGDLPCFLYEEVFVV